MKVCPRCKVEKPADAFAKAANRKDGLQIYCRTCRAAVDKASYERPERQRAIRDSNKARTQEVRLWTFAYLKTHPCVDCGETDPIVLEFDHVQGNKRDAVSRLIRYSLQVVQDEILKCEVRCANCHRRKTAKQFGHYADVP